MIWLDIPTTVPGDRSGGSSCCRSDCGSLEAWPEDGRHHRVQVDFLHLLDIIILKEDIHQTSPCSGWFLSYFCQNLNWYWSASVYQWQICSGRKLTRKSVNGKRNDGRWPLREVLDGTWRQWAQMTRWRSFFVFTGPRCLWGPVYGSRCLYLCTRPLVETWCDSVWWWYQLNMILVLILYGLITDRVVRYCCQNG